MKFNPLLSSSLLRWRIASGLLATLLSTLSLASTDIAATALKEVAPNHYRFDSPSCNLQLDVNAHIGGRITQLLLDNKPVIKTYACSSDQYDPGASCNGSGSTFWTSPQKAWSNGGWPPIASVDGEAYSAHIRNDHLVLNGSTNSLLGASINKDFSVDSTHCNVDLHYAINASREQHVAPWEITRVPRGGVAFFPLGDKSKLATGPLATRISISTNNNIVWFDDTGIPVLPLSGGAKLIADGRDGWLAYALQGRLFIKIFDDVPLDVIAPGEGDVEIYAGEDFLELEAQGRYSSLKSGDTLPWLVRWRIVAIPKSVTIAAGSESLLKFAQQEVSKAH